MGISPNSRTTVIQPTDITLTVHKSGQWCKKVGDKFHYLGRIDADPLGEKAKVKLATILQQVADAAANAGVTPLCQIVAEWKVGRKQEHEAGSIAFETYINSLKTIDAFSEFVGKDCPYVPPVEMFDRYIREGEETKGWGPRTTASYIRIVKAFFRWCWIRKLIPELPKYGARFSAPPAITPEAVDAYYARRGESGKESTVFTPKQVRALLRDMKTSGDATMYAATLLAINTGMGNSDIAALTWGGLGTGRHLSVRRRKTGIRREGWLWKRTVKALAAMKPGDAKPNDLVFLAPDGRPLVVRAEGSRHAYNLLTRAFRRYVRKVLPEAKKLSFYTLRATFRTWADACPDGAAIDRCMGHVTPGASRHYIRGKMNSRRIRRVSLTVLRRLYPKRKKPVKQ